MKLDNAGSKIEKLGALGTIHAWRLTIEGLAILDAFVDTMDPELAIKVGRPLSINDIPDEILFEALTAPAPRTDLVDHNIHATWRHKGTSEERISQDSVARALAIHAQCLMVKVYGQKLEG